MQIHVELLVQLGDAPKMATINGTPTMDSLLDCPFLCSPALLGLLSAQARNLLANVVLELPVQFRVITEHEKQFQVDEEGGKHKGFTNVFS